VTAPDERPMSGSAFLLMTLLIVLAAVVVLRWVLGTLAFLFNTLLLLAVLAGAFYLYLRLRDRKQ
jgi:hypothetical protein